MAPRASQLMTSLPADLKYQGELTVTHASGAGSSLYSLLICIILCSGVVPVSIQLSKYPNCQCQIRIRRLFSVLLDHLLCPPGLGPSGLLFTTLVTKYRSILDIYCLSGTLFLPIQYYTVLCAKYSIIKI